MLKKSVLAVGIFLIATKLWAVPPVLPLDVSQSIHNLSSSGVRAKEFGYGASAGNEDEVCIFCHTPHGGTLNTPLWNRALPDQSGSNSFTHYSSATLSAYTKSLATNRPVRPESLLCMSCHDGAVGMNSIINNSNRLGAQPDNGNPMVNVWVTTAGRVGDIMSPGGFGLQGQTRNLSDDHPISLDYGSAATSAGVTRLHPPSGGTDPRDKGVRFFGTGGELYLECSSCHNPHVNYDGTGGDAAYTPFLVMSNAGSNLCLACHVK